MVVQRHTRISNRQALSELILDSVNNTIGEILKSKTKNIKDRSSEKNGLLLLRQQWHHFPNLKSTHI